MKRLDGKIALVTGASGGIGQALARRLAADGAHVIVNYRSSPDAAEKVAQEIREAGGACEVIQADVADPASLAELFEEIAKRHGGLDILVNNAGLGTRARIAEIEEAEYERTFKVNVKGVLFAMKHAAPHLRDNGRIINISSIASESANAAMGVYSASKAAVNMLSEVAAQEFGERGITVNTVLPGPVVPGMFDSAPDRRKEAAAAASPFNRLGTPEDVADVVAFLASEDSRWITGQHITADGGAKL